MAPQKTESEYNSLGIVVTDHITALLAYWDNEQICRFANAAYRNLFDKTTKEIIGIRLKELLGPLYAQNLPQILGVLEGKPQTFESELFFPVTGVRNVLVNYFPDVKENKIQGFFVHIADITSIKLLEKESERTAKIIAEQNKLLMNFANIVSHNLRSYANNLKAILDLFIKADTEKEKNEMLNYLKHISNEFSETINNLNEVSEIQNRGNINLEKINLYRYAEKAIQIIGIQAKENNTTIDNNISKNIILLANPAYLESVILNILTNAIKYRRPDVNPVIQLFSEVKDRKIVLKIKDNGLGINMQKHKNELFGMYKTFHENPDAKGIGLFITKFQVETMGGRIEVESEENKGSTFCIYFPYDPENMSCETKKNIFKRAAQKKTR